MISLTICIVCITCVPHVSLLSQVEVGPAQQSMVNPTAGDALWAVALDLPFGVASSYTRKRGIGAIPLPNLAESGEQGAMPRASSRSPPPFRRRRSPSPRYTSRRNRRDCSRSPYSSRYSAPKAQTPFSLSFSLSRFLLFSELRLNYFSAHCFEALFWDHRVSLTINWDFLRGSCLRCSWSWNMNHLSMLYL